MYCIHVTAKNKKKCKLIHIFFRLKIETQIIFKLCTYQIFIHNILFHAEHIICMGVSFFIILWNIIKLETH